MNDFQSIAIAHAIGASTPNVALYWPLIRKALALKGINSRYALAAAIATVRVEATSKFAPISELGNAEYFKVHYEDNKRLAAQLGNRRVGDGALFHGRGFVQITGRANYAKYGKLIGVDLVANPELANKPEVAAAIFATYFHDHGVNVWADKAGAAKTSTDRIRCWQMTRKLVNGGLNGFPLYMQALEAVLALPFGESKEISAPLQPAPTPAQKPPDSADPQKQP